MQIACGFPLSNVGGVPHCLFLLCQDELPFAINRTELGKQLPVYVDYKNGRTRVVTQIRKYEGDETVLADEVQRVCGEVRLRLSTDRGWGGCFVG